MPSIPEIAAILAGITTVVTGFGALVRELRRTKRALRHALAAAPEPPALAAPPSVRASSSSLIRVDSDPGEARPRLLVVEDDPHFAKGLRVALRLAGFEVDVAAYPADAIALAARNSYALILADHYLPGMSGLALLEELRQPTILWSGSFVGDGTDAASIGAEGKVDRVLTKAGDLSELIATIRELLRQRAP